MPERRSDRPLPPRPDLSRRPSGGFGWLDASLVKEHWLARIGTNATAVLVLLAIAADERGSSSWSRAKMTRALRISRTQIDAALTVLLHQRLVAHRPWRTGHPDGVWQLLPIPGKQESPSLEGKPRAGHDLQSILRNLGINPS